MSKLNITLITNRNLVNSDEEYLRVINEALESGINNIIFREKTLDYKNQKFYYSKLKAMATNFKCNLMVNSNRKLFEELGADAVHLPFLRFKELSKKERETLNIGVSIHSLEEAIEASRLGAKYILASNIYETKCKEGLEGKGVGFLKSIRRNVECNIIALGGINKNNIKELENCNFHSVALMSLIMESKDVKSTVEELRYSLL